MDEATHFTEFQFSTLTACIRGVNGFPKRMYLTCNPGGVGHAWVKRLFIDRDYKPSENPDDYTFIQAKVTDNRVLMEQDPEYVKMLDNLPDDLRRAWRDGDWDLFAGQYFTEFKRDVHVVEPFQIPKDWRVYRTLDYGLDMLACYWVAMDERGRAYVYKEAYRSDMIISKAAELINSMTTEQVKATFAPPDLWNRRQDTGKSVAQIFAEHGIMLTKASNARVAGWLDVKEWLSPYGEREANLKFFSNCNNIIRSLPQLQHDSHDPSDVATEPHEITHGPDAIRYFCAGRPAPNRPKQPNPHFNFSIEKPRTDPGGRGERVRII
jgi:phage terminase large subunit